jgi:hypothetical protein
VCEEIEHSALFLVLFVVDLSATVAIFQGPEGLRDERRRPISHSREKGCATRDLEGS